MLEYFKSLQFSVMEAAVLDSALAAHADKLASMMTDTSMPALSIRNMRIELEAAQHALGKLAASRFEAVNTLDVRGIGQAGNRYKEFCRLRDYRKPGVEVCQHTEAEAFALATSEDIKKKIEADAIANKEGEKSR